jgi:hypoxanthine-DNA glycosylase
LTRGPDRDTGAGRIRGFPPVCGERPRLLILGSMPGVASLEAVEYYAHPRNAFWPIMQALLGIERALPYAQRCAALEAAGVALWDVFESCVRPGSLDSAIEPASVRANALPALLERHAAIRVVCFNGRAAEQAFRRHVAPLLGPRADTLRQVGLPSTSPANASWSFERKLSAWRVVAEALQG